MNKHILEKIALVTSGVLIGSGVTYIVVKNRLEQQHADILEAELESAREAFKRAYKVFPYNDPPAVLDEPAIYNELATGETETVDQIIADEGYSDVEVDLTAITVNETVEEFKEERRISEVLKRAQENMNKSAVVNPKEPVQLDEVTASPTDISQLGGGNIFEKLVEPSPLETRDTHFPYIISAKEWFTEHQDDHSKTTLTYYTGGKKPELADDKAHILPNIKYLLGSDFARHFGYDKENPQTVFVRNDAIEADFEVILDERSYAEAELGVDPGD